MSGAWFTELSVINKWGSTSKWALGKPGKPALEVWFKAGNLKHAALVLDANPRDTEGFEFQSCGVSIGRIWNSSEHCFGLALQSLKICVWLGIIPSVLSCLSGLFCMSLGSSCRNIFTVLRPLK